MSFSGNCKICGDFGYLHKGKCRGCTTPEEMTAIYEKRKRMDADIRAKQLAKKRNKTKDWHKRQPRKNAIKATGQLALFEAIWNVRPRQSYIDFTPLHEFSVDMFAHVLPKGSYVMYTLNEKNIVLMTPDQHHMQHSMPRSQLETLHPGWKRFFEYQDELREEYNRIFKRVTTHKPLN